MDQQDAIVDSSSTQPDVSDTSSVSAGENVPFHQHPRFRELIEEKNSLRSEIEQLKSMVKPQEQPKQEETIPDFYDDPKAYANYIKEQTIAEIERRSQESTQKTAEATRAIDAQYAKIRETHQDIDEDAIGEFAIEYNIRNTDGRGYDLVKAHQLMLKMDGARDQGSQETADSVKRAKMTSGGGGSTTKEVSGLNFSRQDLRGMSMAQLVANLAKNH